MDSIVIRLLSPLPGGSGEYLSAGVLPAGIALTGQNSPVLYFRPAAAAQPDYLDFQAALRTVRWHDAAPLPTPGTRRVQVVAYAGGTQRDTAYTTINVPPPALAGRDTALAICADADPVVLPALLSPSATVGGTWQPSTLFEPLGSTDTLFHYVVSNGLCPADTATVTIRVNTLPLFSLGRDTTICAGRSLLLNAPFPVQWPGGGPASFTFTADTAGLYTATATSAQGCVFRDSIVLTVLPNSARQQVISCCAGQPFAWNGLVLSRDTALCITLPAANGCDSSDCLSLAFFYPFVQKDTAICAGRSYTFFNKIYSKSGVYADTALLGGCLTALVLNLKVLPPDTVPLVASVCKGKAYAFENQSFTQAGLYLLPGKTQDGCDKVTALELKVVDEVIATQQASICPGETYNFGGKVISAAGLYRDTLISSDGCDSIIVLTLNTKTAPAPQIVGDTLVCAGEKPLLKTSSFAAYQWSNGATTVGINAEKAGLWSLTVTASDGCTGVAGIEIKEVPPVVAEWDTLSPLCHGDKNGLIELQKLTGGQPPIRFSLNGTAFGNQTSFTGLGAGDWKIRAMDAEGCITSFHFGLQNPPPIVLDLGASPFLKTGEVYSISLKISPLGNYSYTWAPTNSLSCTNCPDPLANPVLSTWYYLKVENDKGCTVSDSLWVRVEADEGVYAPNAFQPTGRPENQYFTVFADPERVFGIALLQVYDRWGGLAYERRDLGTSDAQAGWDGTWRGREMPPGVYIWYAEILLKDGTVLRKKGDVTLIK